MSEPVTLTEQITPEDRSSVSRRWVLVNIGIAINGIIGAALAIPVLRYLISPLKRDSAYKSWISLGSIDRFPVGQTSLDRKSVV